MLLDSVREKFTDKENWYGSCYELAIDYALIKDRQSILAVLRALWKLPGIYGPLIGPYASPNSVLDIEPLPASLPPEESIGCYGILEVSEHVQVGFQLIVSEERWLSICVPIGMLESEYSIDYPIALDNDSWGQQLRGRFVAIAEEAYRAMPFHLAAIGEEVVTSTPTEEKITDSDLSRTRYLISSEIFQRVNPSSRWHMLPTGLRLRAEYFGL